MSYQMLKPGGKMVYSTCSFSYEEDEEVIDYLLNNSDAVLLDIEDNPLFYRSRNNGRGIHLLPSLFPGEGHYIALIKKPGELKPHQSEMKESQYLTAKSPYPYFKKYGDFLYTMSEEENVKFLNVIRYGVKVGEVDKQGIRFDYHYAHFIREFDNVVILNDEEIKKYYLGESINRVTQKGYVLIKYQGINVDMAKSDGRIIKNRLPKGLRKKINL